MDFIHKYMVSESLGSAFSRMKRSRGREIDLSRYKKRYDDHNNKKNGSKVLIASLDLGITIGFLMKGMTISTHRLLSHSIWHNEFISSITAERNQSFSERSTRD